MVEHPSDLLSRIVLAARSRDEVHVLATPGFGVEAILSHLPEELRDRVHVVGVEHALDDAFTFMPVPMSRQECAEKIGLEAHDPFLDVLIWLPALHDLFCVAYASYGDRLMDPERWGRHPLFAPVVAQMTRWIEGLAPTLRACAELLCVGPGRVLMSDLEEDVSEDDFLALVQVGLGCVHGAWFERNELAAYVLREEMVAPKREAIFARVDDLLFPGDALQRWPESLVGDFAYSQRCRRLKGFARSSVREVMERLGGEGGAPLEVRQFERALRASSLLGYVSNMDGVIEESKKAHEKLVSRALERAEELSPHALVMAMESLLKNYKALFKVLAPEQLLERAMSLAAPLEERVLMAHLNVSRADLLFRAGEHDEALIVLEACFAQQHAPSTRAMVSSQLARLQKSPAEAIAIMDEAIRVSIDGSLVYCEFVARAYKMVWSIQRGHFELARLQLRQLDELVEERYEDLGIVLEADLHWLRGMYWRSQHDAERAIASYEVVSELFDRLDRVFEKGVLHEAIGQLHVELERFDEAYHHFELANAFYIHTEESSHYELRALAWKTFALLKNSSQSEQEYHAHLRRVPGLLDALDALSEEVRQALSFQEIYPLLRGELRKGARRARVAADGRYIVTVEGERVSLGSRQVLQQVVRALVSLKGRASASELMPHVWPDEQMTLQSGKNRVRVAISTLRKLGLRGSLEFDADTQRYVLDAEVEGAGEEEEDESAS